jgi:general transcription factor 3C polypeptide 3 (transcription factor C subunit 4)
VEHARKLITAHQFNNEPQRILLAALSSGLRPTDAFITSTLQKHLFREMKLADTAVRTPEVLKWNALNKRYAPMSQMKAEPGAEGEDDADDVDGTGAGVEKDGPGLGSGAGAGAMTEIPTKNNPILVAIYGQICIAAKSYQSAICKSLPDVIYISR